MSAFIRLGTKYDIGKLCIEGKKRIFEEIPIDLAHLEPGGHHYPYPRADHEPTWKFVAKPGHWFELVAFARTTGLLSLLPFVFYICCQQYGNEIVTGARRQDGTTIAMSMPDQITCLSGYNSIYNAQYQLTFTWSYSTPADCSRPMCSTIKQELVESLFIGMPTVGGLDNFDKLDFRVNDLCSVCADEAERVHNTEREEFWRRLPWFFRLPWWDELYEERELYVLVLLI